MSGITAVTARMADIRSRMGGLAGTPVGTSSSASASTASAPTSAPTSGGGTKAYLAAASAADTAAANAAGTARNAARLAAARAASSQATTSSSAAFSDLLAQASDAAAGQRTTAGAASTAAATTPVSTVSPAGTVSPVSTVSPASTVSSVGTAATARAATSAAATPRAVTSGAVKAPSTAATDPVPGSTSGSGPTGADLVQAAKRYLGVPYRWGGTDPATGLDCSGLVQRALKDVGVSAPRVVADQRYLGTKVASLDDARPGDLIVMGGSSHIGIYVGDGKMLHAPHTGDVVKISKIWETPTAIRRVVGGSSGSATASTASVASVATTSTLDAAAARPVSLRTGSGVDRYAALFAAATEKYGLPEGLLAAVAQQESGGNASAVSPAGARGLMQIMPATARGLGVDPMDPAQAVDGAARLLSSALRTYHGSVPLALASYNAGPGAVARYGGVPPYAETQSYVRRITAALGLAA